MFCKPITVFNQKELYQERIPFSQNAMPLTNESAKLTGSLDEE